MIIFNFFKYLFLYIKYYRILKPVYDEMHITKKLSETCKCNFKEDWVGRIYAVLNPNVQNIWGEIVENANVYENFGDPTQNNKDYITAWMMRRLVFVNNIIHADNLFELVGYEIKPIENDNYLFIIFPLPFPELKLWAKRFGILMAVLAALIPILLIILL